MNTAFTKLDLEPTPGFEPGTASLSEGILARPPARWSRALSLDAGSRLVR